MNPPPFRTRRLATETVEVLAPFVPHRDLRRMRVVQSAPWRWLPLVLGMGAVTFDRFVIFRTGQFDERQAWGLALIAHEAVHVGQVRKAGLPRFLLRYLLGQLRCGFRHDRHPMEVPAIEVQTRVRDAITA